MAAKWQFCAPNLFTICDFHINLLILKTKTWGFEVFFSPFSLSFPFSARVAGWIQWLKIRLCCTSCCRNGFCTMEWGSFLCSAVVFGVCSSSCQLVMAGQQLEGIPLRPVFPQGNSEECERERGESSSPFCGKFTRLKVCISLINAGLRRKQPSPKKEDN